MNSATDSTLSNLLSAARAVRGHAYAPYSGFSVGAAVLAASGRIYVGCNVENASYGATLCAERSAVTALIAGGDRELSAVAVFTDAAELAMPCGLCRQVLYEFGPHAVVIVGNPREQRELPLHALLPEPFVLKR